MKKNKGKRYIRQHSIPIRFTATEFATIRRLARQEHDYVSGFLRRMILKCLDGDDKKKDNQARSECEPTKRNNKYKENL